MSIRKKGLVLAMEDDEIRAEASDEVEIAEGQAEVQEIVSDTQEEAVAIENLMISIEESEEAADTLGDIQEELEETVEEGSGASESTAAVAEVAIESICSRLGISNRIIPAMESFGSTNSRMTSTRIAIENIGDTIKRIWEAIKKAVKSVYQKIADFFARFFDNTEKVTKQAKALKDKAYQLRGQKPEKSEIKDAGLAKLFNDPFTGQTDPEAVMKNHVGFTKGSVKIIQSLSAAANVLDKLIKADVKADDVKKVSDSFDELERVVTQCMVQPRKEKKTDGNYETTYIVDGPYVSGQMIEFSFKMNTKTGYLVGVNTHFGESTIADKQKEPSKETFPTATGDQQVALLDEVVALMRDTEEYKKKSKDIQSIGVNAIKAIDGVLGIADTIAENADTNSDIKGLISTAREAINGLANAGARLAMMTPAWNVKLAHGIMRFVAKSQAEFKKS